MNEPRTAKVKALINLKTLGKSIRKSSKKFDSALTRRQLKFPVENPFTETTNDDNEIPAIDISTSLSVSLDDLTSSSKKRRSQKREASKEITHFSPSSSIESLLREIDQLPFFTMAEFDEKYFKKQLISHIPKFTGKREDIKKFLDCVETLFNTIPADSANRVPALIKFLVQYHCDSLSFAINFVFSNRVKELREYYKAMKLKVNRKKLKKKKKL